MLTRLIAVFVDPIRSLFRPPAAPSTDAEMREVEEGIEMDAVPESVRRARSMVGRGRYCLGAGGRAHDAADPLGRCARPKEHSHTAAGRVFCDCSGFVAWCVGLPRRRDVDPGPAVDEVWFYTDALEADARGSVRGDLGYEVPWDQAEPGDLLVYGAGPRIGHVGIVSACDSSGASKVIHCSASGTPAIKETGVSGFRARGAVVMRLR